MKHDKYMQRYTKGLKWSAEQCHNSVLILCEFEINNEKYTCCESMAIERPLCHAQLAILAKIIRSLITTSVIKRKEISERVELKRMSQEADEYVYKEMVKRTLN